MQSDYVELNASAASVICNVQNKASMGVCGSPIASGGFNQQKHSLRDPFQEPRGWVADCKPTYRAMK